MSKKNVISVIIFVIVASTMLFFRGYFDREEEMTHESIKPFLSEDGNRGINENTREQVMEAIKEYSDGAASLEPELFTSVMPGMTRLEVTAIEGDPDADDSALEESSEAWFYARSYQGYDGVLAVFFSTDTDIVSSCSWFLDYRYGINEADVFFERVIAEYSLGFEEVEKDIKTLNKRMAWKNEVYYLKANLSFDEEGMICELALEFPN